MCARRKRSGMRSSTLWAIEFAWRILEDLAGLIAGQQDGPRLIHDERGVRRLREDTFQGRGKMHRWGTARISQIGSTFEPVERVRNT